MDITITMLVSDKEHQEKYKRIIEYYLKKNLDTPKFKIYTTIKELYSDFADKGERSDLILLQASPANFEIMNKVREVDRNCIIIYPAKTMDWVLQAFDSMPMAYVMPHESSGDSILALAIIKAAKYINSARKQLSFETKSKVLKYALYEIDYFESQYRLVHIVKRNGHRETINKKLDDIEDENRMPNFCRCHQSFLVNMDNIKYIDKTTKTIFFYSGQSVPSSKKLFTGFLATYKKYKGGLGNVI